MISAKFVPLKYYTLSSQLQRLASFSVECSGRRILSPGQINIMRKWCISPVQVQVITVYGEIKMSISAVSLELKVLVYIILRSVTRTFF